MKPHFSNSTALFAPLQLAAARSGQRVVAWLPATARDCAALRLEPHVKANDLRRGSTPGQADRIDTLQQLLGQEHQRLLIDATGSTDPDMLAAALGTLKGGGVALVLHEFAADAPSAFARWLYSALERGSEPCPELDWPGARIVGANTPPIVDTEATAEPLWRLQQDRALTRMRQFLAATERAAILLEARRGRGKSTLIARFLLEHKRPAVLCSSRKEHLDTLRAKLATDTGDAPLRCAVDQALEQTGELLIVDEAATIPLPTLLKLAERYRQLILASTSDGYEGAGRALSLRLQPQLQSRGIRCLTPRLTRPVRWRSDDRLEPLLDELLLLQGTLPHLPCKVALPRMLRTTAATLPPPLLRSVFTLLRTQHYQSTLRDLAHLFDAPDQALLLAIDPHQPDFLLGALWATREGGIDATLHQDILDGRRRPRDQILPQVLALARHQPDPLELHYWRVARIAVHPEARRLGIGSALLETLFEARLSDGRAVDAVGASFGADAATLAFWQANEFNLVQQGKRVNPRSALRSATLIRYRQETRT